MNRFLRSCVLAALTAAALAACGGSSTTSNPPAAGPRALRGAVTATGTNAITVNGVHVATAGATVRFDDNLPHGANDLKEGMIVTVRGTFDDRTGTATEIEYEHGVEGEVEFKDANHVRIAGTSVQIDDTVHFDDRLGGTTRFDAITAGSIVAISGVPVGPSGADDKGGLRASRVDLSPRHGTVAAHDLDVKGFVSNLSGSSFDLKLTPDAAGFYTVDATGASTGVANGQFVEVHASTIVAGTPPEIAHLVASNVRIEDRFAEAEAEVEGYVSTISGTTFFVDGVMVHTDSSTVYQLGATNTFADVAVGVKLEAEGSLDADGMLMARRISFRPGARLTAKSPASLASPFTLLGKTVVVPPWAENKFTGALGTDLVEVRGFPSADGTKLVAYRLDNGSGGNASRAFVRAVVTAKDNTNPAQPTFTVFGYGVTTAGAKFLLSSAPGDAGGVPAATFYAAVTPGITVVKVRAADAATVIGGNWPADEIEIEGNDH